MQWLGFGPKIHAHIKMLFMDANVQLVVNGSLSPQFPLQKSICQGCPLARFLYVLATNALGYLFHHAQANKLIRGIYLPNNATKLNSHFTDDSMLFIQNSTEEVTNTIDTLDLFCTISGSKLAMHKTTFIMTRPNLRPAWIPSEWKEIKHGLVTSYLGIPFGVGVSLKEMWKRFLNKIKGKLLN